MDDNNQTSGQPKPEPEECVKEQKITDHFKIMIDKARKAQKLVLIKRVDDLLRWGAQEEYDFSKIFGVKGNKEVNIRKYGHNTGRRMNARFLMMDGVRRLMIIANDLTMSSFINYTGCNEFAAFVSPSKDMPYIINIGAKFEYRDGKKNPVTGKDSHVATLCHEMSHIQWYYGDNKKGGMWSQDYTTTDKYSTCKEDEVSYDEHIRIATKLISKQKDQIFENAYNIERYFEIRLIESEIDSINDEILSNSVKKKIAELEKALLH
ncbi:TPA: peptidase M35 [Escherichia coli]|nr:peptidase M35 [Escherichia coli]